MGIWWNGISLGIFYGHVFLKTSSERARGVFLVKHQAHPIFTTIIKTAHGGQFWATKPRRKSTLSRRAFEIENWLFENFADSDTENIGLCINSMTCMCDLWIQGHTYFSCPCKWPIISLEVIKHAKWIYCFWHSNLGFQDSKLTLIPWLANLLYKMNDLKQVRKELQSNLVSAFFGFLLIRSNGIQLVVQWASGAT